MFKKTTLTAITALTIMSTAVVPALASTTAAPSAASQSTQLSQQMADQHAQQQKFHNTVDSLQQFVHRNADGTFSLKLPTGLTNKLDATSYAQVVQGMSFVNSLILEGKLKSTSSLQVYDPTVNNNFSVQGNLNQISWHWWGLQIYLNNTNTQKLIWLIAGGAGAVTIGAAIAGMVPGGQLISGILWIFDGVIAIGGAAIGYNDVNGQGVVFDCTYPTPVSPPIVWISSQ